jgi:archaellum component FlaG (FlaF/FlaG flagellin family)
MYHQSKWSSGKSILLILLMVCSLIFGVSVGSAEAASATLAWNAAPGVSGYKVHYGTASGTYTGSLNAGQATAYTVSNLTTGTKYYFAVTSYDSTGIESDYSNEVSGGGTGGTSSSCTYNISPSSASFTSSGGTGSIAVGTASGCSWSASTGVSWATITSGSSGSGSGSLSYKVVANTGSARSASFSVAGKTFTISQSAASSTSTTTKYTITIKYAGTGSGTVTATPVGPYTDGAYVTLKAVPSTGSVFAGWSGLCPGSTSTTCAGYMRANYTATATFNRK